MIDPYGHTVYRCQIALPAPVRDLSPNGPATFVRVGNGPSVLYWSAEPEVPGGQAMFSLCTQEYWIHISGSIPAAAWATDLDLLWLSAAGRSATAGGGWTPATDRPDGRSGPPEPSAQRVFPLNTGVRDRHTEPSGCTNTESNPSAAGELA
jgi:hypothetical protein